MYVCIDKLNTCVMHTAIITKISTNVCRQSKTVSHEVDKVCPIQQ